jgi:hypothetical protein
VIHRLGENTVCAGGGNPDPTSTRGKKVAEAKQIEHNGWDFPKQLAGRAYCVVVLGHVATAAASPTGWSGWA